MSHLMLLRLISIKFQLSFGESLKEYKVVSTENQDKKGVCPQWRNHSAELGYLQASITCNLYKKV